MSYAILDILCKTYYFERDLTEIWELDSQLYFATMDGLLKLGKDWNVQYSF